MRLALGSVLLVLVASQATAQVVTVETGSFGEPLVPLSGTRAVAGNVTAPCLLSPEGEAVGVRLEVDGPAVGSARAAPSYVEPDGPCEGSFTTNFTVLVSFEPSARALQTYVYTVRASAANATLNLTTNASVTAAPAFFSILDAAVHQTIRLVPPGDVATYRLTVTNFGNGLTTALFEVTEKGDGFSVAAPNPVTLEPGANATIPLSILAPSATGYANQVGATTFRITSHFSLDPRLKGDETSVSVLTTVRGWSLPSTGGIAVAALVAAAALAFRRR